MVSFETRKVLNTNLTQLGLLEGKSSSGHDILYCLGTVIIEKYQCPRSYLRTHGKNL